MCSTKKHQVFNRHLLTALAALFVPIVGILVYLGFWTINTLLRTCTEHSYKFSSYLGRESYVVCTNPGAAWIIPLLILAPFLVLSYLYSRVRIVNPLKRAALVTALIAVAFSAEFFGGAVLILTGVGGIVYLIMIPVVVGWITVWYRRHLGKEANGEPTIQEEHLTNQKTETENHDEDPTNTSEPPQQNSTSASTQ